MKKILVSMLLMIPLISSATDNDLTLPGERWIGKFTQYLCQAFGPQVALPQQYHAYNFQFERMTTDYSLDNGLLKATFEEDGHKCRYSAILIADNDNARIDLVQSKAYSLDQASECLRGKEVLDLALNSNDYLYYGHPHNIAILVPLNGVEQVCGANATHIGINFVVTGRL